jgi:hypothetical protein
METEDHEKAHEDVMWAVQKAAEETPPNERSNKRLRLLAGLLLRQLNHHREQRLLDNR